MKGLHCTLLRKSIAPGWGFEQQGPLRRPYSTHVGCHTLFLGVRLTLPLLTGNQESGKPQASQQTQIGSQLQSSPPEGSGAPTHNGTSHLREEKTEVGGRVSNAPRLTGLDRARLRTPASQAPSNAPPLIPKVSGKGLLGWFMHLHLQSKSWPVRAAASSPRGYGMPQRFLGCSNLAYLDSQ